MSAAAGPARARRTDVPAPAELKIGEVSKLLGAEWKQMTDADKEEYQKLAAADKARYDREMELYKTLPPLPAED